MYVYLLFKCKYMYECSYHNTTQMSRAGESASDLLWQLMCDVAVVEPREIFATAF